ncbi:unnamed protein product [Ectocarpus sp. CCAP 1310/34]|nr:unnamed protein product [Ectocarpus sp. CCAP 1310/34]
MSDPSPAAVTDSSMEAAADAPGVTAAAAVAAAPAPAPEVVAVPATPVKAGAPDIEKQIVNAGPKADKPDDSKTKPEPKPQATNHCCVALKDDVVND